jgi:hypothetical protein
MDDFWDDPGALPPKPADWTGPDLGPIFTATYESDSACCGEMIMPGEDARADGRGGWIHADTSCEAIVRAVATGSDDLAAGRLCPQCFCFHAGECA